MSKPIVIEVSGQPLGVVVPSGNAFRFLAVKFPVFAIDGQTFDTIEDARRAASRTVNPKPAPDGDVRGFAA